MSREPDIKKEYNKITGNKIIDLEGEIEKLRGEIVE
jgi:uncharacterized protein YjbJ (UPF0337 family)